MYIAYVQQGPSSAPGDAVHLRGHSGDDRVGLGEEHSREGGGCRVRRGDEGELFVVAGLAGLEARGDVASAVDVEEDGVSGGLGAPAFVARGSWEALVLEAQGLPLALRGHEEPAEAEVGDGVAPLARRRDVAARRDLLGGPDLGRKRVIQRRFDLDVPRARVREPTFMLRDRAERCSLVQKSAKTSGNRPR